MSLKPVPIHRLDDRPMPDSEFYKNDCSCTKNSCNCQGNNTLPYPIKRPLQKPIDNSIIEQANLTYDAELIPSTGIINNNEAFLFNIKPKPFYIPSIPITTDFENPFTKEIIVSAVVLDDFGKPMKDAHVYEKGNTKNGTTTGSDGKFTLKIKERSQLVVSYVGVDSLVINAGKVPTTIILTGATELDEVILTASKPQVQTAGFGKIGLVFLGALFLGKLFLASEDNATTTRKRKSTPKRKTVKASI